MLHDLLGRAGNPCAGTATRSTSRCRASTPAGSRWVRPELVGEVQYRTLTSDNRLRHAAWRGVRPDRDPDEVLFDGSG